MNQYKRWALYTAAAFLLISAALINTPNLYYMAAVLIALPWISYGLGMMSLRGLEFGREVPTAAWEGQTTDYWVVVRSVARLPRLFLQVDDSLPQWVRSISARTPLFNAEPGAVTRVPCRVALTKRGVYQIDSMRVTALDPLGIYSFSQSFPVHSELVVYPTPQPMANFALSGAERFGFRDLPIAATRGNGIDPDGVREYIPGDPLRRMHWKSTARTGRLSVIEFEEAHAVNVVLAVDCWIGGNVGEGRDAAIEYLVTAAASAAQMAIRQGASARLAGAGGATAANAPRRGTDHLLTILAALARIEATSQKKLSAQLLERVGPIPPGTTLIVFTACADPDLPGVLAHCRMTGAEVVVFYLDPHSFPGGLRRVTSDAQDSFLQEIAAAQCTTYIVRANAEREIRPELVTHLGAWHAQVPG